MKNKVKKPKIQWFENSYNLDECFPPVRVQITWATTVSAFQKLKMYVKVYFQLNVEYICFSYVQLKKCMIYRKSLVKISKCACFMLIIKSSRRFSNIRNNHLEVFLGKAVNYSKFTGEHPRGSVISIKLLCNFIEIALRHGCSPANLLRVFRTYFDKNTYVEV